MNDTKITAEEIIEEILPLIREYFVAECLSCKNEIELIFSDGQTVKISAEA